MQCRVDTCNVKSHARGYCNRHYAQIKRNGKIVHVAMFQAENKIIDDPAGDSILEIVGTDRYVARVLFDRNKLNLVCSYLWSYDKTNGYAKTYVKNKKHYLHRLLTNARSGQEVDHINQDKLDNRLKNLRFATRSQNAQNRKPKGAVKFLGVSFDKSRAKYAATIRGRHIGRYATPEEAARQYDRIAQEEYGPFANLNFKESTSNV